MKWHILVGRALLGALVGGLVALGLLPAECLALGDLAVVAGGILGTLSDW